MKTNDFVHYIAQSFVKYVDQPKDERKRIRTAKKEGRASLWYRWFGILPYIVYLGVKRKKQ
ncbi:YqzE family protein [Neobacillus piezotolerans]|uniref:YqzE family protein n=1 Tax=Neobacillus piezotolerans TaxID=2259171 RepID=A0A3D8GLB0_9BACI|nr:YqzE family protein [Neobacillus piezotolerans]RDU35131.1 YqzE family protein [Neobacillus piezotolerans]